MTHLLLNVGDADELEVSLWEARLLLSGISYLGKIGTWTGRYCLGEGYIQAGRHRGKDGNTCPHIGLGRGMIDTIWSPWSSLMPLSPATQSILSLLWTEKALAGLQTMPLGCLWYEDGQITSHLWTSDSVYKLGFKCNGPSRFYSLWNFQVFSKMELGKKNNLEEKKVGKQNKPLVLSFRKEKKSRHKFQQYLY